MARDSDGELVCDECDKALTDYRDVGYDGPIDRDGRPNPSNSACTVFAPWKTLCVSCASDELEAAG